jgi:hypothetical protein
MAITMSRAQYDALLALAATANATATADLRRTIDAANGITRYVLTIRWQDVGGTQPTRIELGKGWPPEQTYVLELERKITREDVDAVLEHNATNPVSVMVTADPYGVIGWYLLEDYDFQSGG